MCPHCGGCYCTLDEKAKRVVDEFYEIHCKGRNCPYGKIRIPPPPRPKVIRPRMEIYQQRARKAKERVESIEKTISRLEKYLGRGIPWYYPDHGINHMSRVEENVEKSVIEIKSDELGGYQLSEDDIVIIKSGALLHDIGNSVDRERHGQYTSILLTNDVRPILEGMGYTDDEIKDFILTSETVKRTLGTRLVDVAKISALHSRSDSEELLRTSDIKLSLEAGLLTKRESALLTILRVADALDADSKRVDKDAKGNRIDDTWIERVQRELEGVEEEITLKHILGMKSLEKMDLRRENGRLKLMVKVNAEMTWQDPENIGRAFFKIMDIVKDIDTTLISCLYIIRIDCFNEAARKQLISQIRMGLNKEVEEG
jgi:hypothetical protein